MGCKGSKVRILSHRPTTVRESRLAFASRLFLCASSARLLLQAEFDFVFHYLRLLIAVLSTWAALLCVLRLMRRANSPHLTAPSNRRGYQRQAHQTPCW